MLATICASMTTVKKKTTQFTSSFLTFGRELDKIRNGKRTVTQRENFIPQITTCQQKMAHIWIDELNKHDKQQHRPKKYADKKNREGISLIESY